MQFDLAQSPFSRRGSYLQVERGFRHDAPRAMIGSARRSLFRKAGDGWAAHFFALRCPGDADYDVAGHPDHCAAATAEGGGWRAAVADARTLVFRADAGMTFGATRPMAWAAERGGTVVIADAAGNCVHHFKPLGPGTLALTARVDPNRPGKTGAAHYLFDVTARPAPGGGSVEVAYRCSPHEGRFDDPVAPFDAARDAASADYARWRERAPAVGDEFARAAEFAWFMLWNQEVPVAGRRAVVMSRFAMNSVWAWDACLDAIGIADADSQLAWDQVLLHLDHQTPDGRVPDSVDDRGPVFVYCKPPVQGWTVGHLLDAIGVEACRDRLAEAYEPLLAWTAVVARVAVRPRRRPVPLPARATTAAGDNATVFAEPGRVVTPELQAYLAIQMERPGPHRPRARQTRGRLREPGRAAGRGDAGGPDDRRPARQRSAPTGALRPSTSTITRIPILLGGGVPASLRANLIADLSPRRPAPDRARPGDRGDRQPRLRRRRLLARADLGARGVHDLRRPAPRGRGRPGGRGRPAVLPDVRPRRGRRCTRTTTPAPAARCGARPTRGRPPRSFRMAAWLAGR